MILRPRPPRSPGAPRGPGRERRYRTRGRHRRAARRHRAHPRRPDRGARRRVTRQRRARARPPGPRHVVRHPRRHRRARHPVHRSRPCSTDPDHPTSTAAATLDESGAATYVFDLHWNLPPVQLPEGTTHVHIGSIGTTLTPGDAEVTAACGTLLCAAGTVSYDPNVRPTIMGSADAVRPRVEELVALSDVVKCSEDDIEWLYPGESPSQVMARWAALGAGLTVVTLGARGVTWGAASGDEESEAARTPDGRRHRRRRRLVHGGAGVRAARRRPARQPRGSRPAAPRRPGAGAPRHRPRPGDERPHGAPRRCLRPTREEIQ